MEKGFIEKYWKKSRMMGERIQTMAAVQPNVIAMYHGDREETWKEFDENTNRLANALLDLGAKKGDLCPIMLPNCPEYIEVEYACAKIGVLACSGINYRYTPKEVEYVINTTLAGDPKFLVLDEDFIDKIKEIRPNLKKLENYIIVGENVPNGMLSYDDLIRSYPKTEPVFDWEIKPEGDSIIIMTGGTTGYPKGAIFRNEDYVLAAEDLLLTALLGEPEKISHISDKTLSGSLKTVIPAPLNTITPIIAPFVPIITNFLRTEFVSSLLKDLSFQRLMATLVGSLIGRGFISRLLGGLKFYVTSPMFHGAAMYGVSAFLLSAGGRLVFPVKKMGFDPREFCETIERRKVAVSLVIGDAMAIPLLSYLESHKGEHDLSSLICLTSSGVHWTDKIKKKLVELMPWCLMIDVAGSSEMFCSGAGMTTFETRDEAKTASFGSLMKALGRIRVINPETWEDIKPGEVGEVIFSGHMSRGYYGDPERTTEFYKEIDGKIWQLTKDAGTVDKDGSYHLIGRTSGIINTGGEKVYPEEVEDIIRVHPKVNAVSVTSLPDERWGEAVTAAVELKPGEKATEDEIRDWCKERMAFYKVPKHVLIVPKVPLNPVGKIEKPRVKGIAKIWYEKKRLPTTEELDEEMRKGKKI